MATTPAGGGEHSTIMVPPEPAKPEQLGEMVKAERKLNSIVFGVALLEWAGNAVGTVASLWATVILLGAFCSQLNPRDFWFATAMIFIEATRVFIRNDASVNQWLFGSTRAFRFEDFSFARMLSGSKQGSIKAVLIGVSINLIPMIGPEIVVGVLKAALLIIISQFLARRPMRGDTAFALLFILALAARGLYYVITERGKGRTKGAKLTKYNLKRAVLATLSKLKPVGLLLAWFALTMLLSRFAIIIGEKISTKLTNPNALLGFEVVTAACLACLPFLQAILHPYYYTYFSVTAAVLLLLLGVGDPDKTENNRPRSPIFQILDTIQPILFLWALMCPLPGISLKLSFYIVFPALVASVTGNLQIPVAFLQVVLSGMRLSSLLGSHHHDYQPLPQGVSPNMVPSIVIFFMLELWQGSSYIMATILGLISRHYRGSLVRASGFREQWGEGAVNLYYHQAYQTHLEKGLLPAEKYTPSLASFAIDSLGCMSCEAQLVGLRILDSFLEQASDSESRKKKLTTEITSTSKNVVSTLVQMLDSSVAQDKNIRLYAARVIAKLAGSLKISEFPGMVKMVCSLLDAKNQQDALPNPASENNASSIRNSSALTRGERSSSQRMLLSLSGPPIPTESVETDLDSFPVLGMQILESLAYDPDNCAGIVKDTRKIIIKITQHITNYCTTEGNSGDTDTQQKEVICSSLNLVRRLATTGGATFRQELWENPSFVNSVESILDLQHSQPELWEPVIDVIAKLTLDEAPRQVIGSTQGIIGKLMHAFLRPDDLGPSTDNYHSLQLAAGEALVNLTIMCEDNCWAILEEPGYDNLTNSLIDMLDNDYAYLAANLLYNLCADHSRDKLIGLADAKEHLESAMPKVMEHIKTKEGKQLEALLCAASQLGYAIPERFAWVLDSDAYQATLVKKLLDTLNSNMKPCPEYPRMRRVIIEMIISIVKSCPGYINIFTNQRAMDALDKVKRTPSRLEKCRVFLDGEGVVAESSPMGDLVDKAKNLIQ
ncbi:hypothetical protein ACP4OV_018427 [Aristida adscensionis]